MGIDKKSELDMKTFLQLFIFCNHIILTRVAGIPGATGARQGLGRAPVHHRAHTHTIH